MAVGEIFKMQWGLETDGAVAVNTLYYEQVSTIEDETNPEAQLVIDWFERQFSPFDLLAARLPETASVNIVNVQRVRPMLGLQKYRDPAQQGKIPIPIGSQMPTIMNVQATWHSETNPSDLTTNRMNLTGFQTSELNFVGWASAFITFLRSWAPALQTPAVAGFGTPWRLKFRLGTTGTEEEVTYQDAYMPFYRSFPVRVPTRVPRTLMG